jgi:hypothetical protein
MAGSDVPTKLGELGMPGLDLFGVRKERDARTWVGQTTSQPLRDAREPAPRFTMSNSLRRCVLRAGNPRTVVPHDEYVLAE